MNLRSLLRSLLPYRRTTEARAREAIMQCGISPDAIAWHVGPDGSFAFGRKSPEDDVPAFEQIECLVAWTRRERIRTGIIGWETREG
jgi:hypothetical protein